MDVKFVFSLFKIRLELFDSIFGLLAVVQRYI